MSSRLYRIALTALALSLTCGSALAAEAPPAETLAAKVGTARGLVAVVGVPGGDAKQIVGLASGNELMLYVQCPDADSVAAVRAAAEKAGMLGTRICAEQGPASRLYLAGNLADAVIVADGTEGVDQTEVMRVLRPGGKAIAGGKVAVKPAPSGTDDWSHPYHSPDNNPQSTDQLAKAPYLTHFLAKPMFSSQPEVTVVAGGRIFKAFGHMAFREYQNKMINTLIAMSAYNGTVLWERKLTPGYMIHRNCMVATEDALYLSDAVSCKRIDAATGKVVGELAPPADVAGGTVWKWMALGAAGTGEKARGVMYALIGGSEQEAPVTPSRNQGVAGWPWGMWPGYDYKNETGGWGFGRTFLAIDVKTGEVLWSRALDSEVDSRGVCMNGDRIFYYCRGKMMGCLNAADGKDVWKSSDEELLKAIGPDYRAQVAYWGFTTSVYAKCNDKVVVFAGPQRTNLVAVSAADGKLLWQKTPPDNRPQSNPGNCQIVLRTDALYAMNPRGSEILDYETGRVIKSVRGRQACTRATGSIDSIFFRGRGTVRWDLASGLVEHIAPFRPACHDGVVISNGMLYWGPWICGCALSLFGVQCLEPAADFNFKAPRQEAGQLVWDPNAPAAVLAAKADPGDWPAFRHDAHHSSVTPVEAPAAVRAAWTFSPAQSNAASAPVAADGFVYVGGSDGVLRAIAARDGKLKWKACTGGAINFPPAIADGKAYVGSCDGWVHVYAAATGNRLWKFRVAPIERRIPVYGQLASNWPVSGGVVVDRGTVYAAAGIGHYDTTHVYALDAETGKVKWYNGATGSLDPNVHNGIGVYGPLRIQGNTLAFHGGNVYPQANYSLADGTCLTKPAGQITASQRVIFYPRDEAEPLTYYRAKTDGGELALLRGRVGFYQAAAADQPPPPRQPVRGGPQPPAGKPVWLRGPMVVYKGFVQTPKALLIAGVQRDDEGKLHGAVIALNRADGQALWSHRLPAEPAEWPLAVDRDGRIFVSLTDGKVVCLAPAAEVAGR